MIAYSMKKIERKELPNAEAAKEPATRLSWLVGALMIGAGVVVRAAAAAADDGTGIGVADDPILFPAAGGLIIEGALAF
ncbi:hypothetical protein [Streptomyces sp. NPDC001820]|uniref:hypothetical protein n=1 Tax=Streptomyces sp. NPDC001820 TaxID=3364613 RepID=UPI0036CF75B2